MVSSFHPHSMCKKVERVMAKTGCTSCTKRTISFKVSGFHTETRLLQRDFILLNLFELLTFCVFKMHHSKPYHQFSTLPDFIWYFSCIYWFFWAKWPWISKVERVTAKTGCTSCTKWTISFKVSTVRTKTHLLQRDFIFFEIISTPDFFAFRAHHSKRRHQFPKLSDIICYFLVIYRFV